MSTEERENPRYTVHIGPEADGGPEAPDLSPREAVERWLARQHTKRQQTVSTYHYRLNQFVEWCEENGVESIRDVNGWIIESFETDRRDAGLAPVSLNKQMGTLKTFLEYCERVELVKHGLAEKVEPPDIPEGGDVDETKLHPDDARALLDYYMNSPEVRYTREHALLALAWYTGARRGALRGLDLSDYDPESQHIEFHHRPDQDCPLKNGRGGERFVALPDVAVEILDGYIQRYRHDVYDEYGRQPLLTSTVGRPAKTTVASWMYLATVPCLHSECPHGKDPETCEWLNYSSASQCPSSRSPHQVRRGAITHHLNRGIPIDVVSKRVNSSARIIEKHYDKPTHVEEMEARRRSHIRKLDFDGEDNGGATE